MTHAWTLFAVGCAGFLLGLIFGANLGRAAENHDIREMLVDKGVLPGPGESAGNLRARLRRRAREEGPVGGPDR